MPAPSTDRQNVIVLVVLLVSQLLLMSSSARRESAPALESWVMRLSWPAVRLAQFGAGVLRRGSTDARHLLAAHARNAGLENRVRRLSDELVRYRESESENRRLRSLLGMREELAPESIAASIVTSNLSGPTRMIIVDRGRADGVRVDLAVVAWGGVVGRVVAVDERHAKIRLLTDANSGVAGIVQRSRVRGIVEGRGARTLYLLYVPRFADAIHGDRVVTSGQDGIFPRGFGIGRVAAIHESPDGTQTIHLEAELGYDSLEEVLILRGPGPGEFETAKTDTSGDAP